MRTLRQILKLCKVGTKLTKPDSAVVIKNVIASIKFTDRQKEVAAEPSTWFCVRSVVWGGRKFKCLHMCSANASQPLTLSSLEARASTRAPRARKSTNERDKVLAACRTIIAPQIAKYRADFWSTYEQHVRAALAMQMAPPKYPLCPLTGRCLKTCATHVDHAVVPFVRLVEAWVNLTGQTFEQIGSTVRKSRGLGRLTLGSTLVDQSWAEYHLTNAKLQLTEAKANIAKGARQVSQ